MNHDKLYSFTFRGLLTGVALDKTGHNSREKFSELWEIETAKRLGIPLLDEELTVKARKMAIVYVAICTFENSIRKFIENKFKDEKIDDWWDNNVKSTIKDKAEGRKNSENSIRWLTPRGSSKIYYTEFGDLISIMCSDTNWDLFEVHLINKEWAKGIITTLEKSRNIIMHSGELAQVDIERVGMFIRDWINQVG